MEVRLLIVTRSIIITLIMVCMLSCEKKTKFKQSDETKSTEEIIVYLVDQFTKPIPPPPKSLENNKIPVSKDLDRMFSVGLKRVMHPISSEYSNTLNQILNSIDTTFIINHDRKKELEIDLDRLRKDGKYVTRYINDEEKNSFESVDIIYDFSTINFNHDYSKAVLIMGMSRGKLNGFADILVLEKIKDQWKIIARKNLVIS